MDEDWGGAHKSDAIAKILDSNKSAKVAEERPIESISTVEE